MFNNDFDSVGRTLKDQVLLLQREIEFLRAEAQELEEYAEWAYEEEAHVYACADIHQAWICAVDRAYNRGCCRTLVEDILTCPYGLGDF